MTNSADLRFRERLLPPWWVFALLLLLVPAALLVFTPIDIRWGIAVAAVLVLGIGGALLLGAPRVAIEGGTLEAGRGTIPVAALGTPEALETHAARDAMTTGWDAAAFHVTVPWTRALVRVPVQDEADPTTAWVISSRRPAALAQAIADAQTASAKEERGA